MGSISVLVQMGNLYPYVVQSCRLLKKSKLVGKSNVEKGIREKKKNVQDDAGASVSDFVLLPPSRLQCSPCVSVASEIASNCGTLSLHQTEVPPIDCACEGLLDRLRIVGMPLLCRDTLKK
jgi:hypothetical protein